MASNSKKAVVVAIAGNSLVACAKWVAFVFTGSGSMLSEAVHSMADVMNQILLLVGIVRSGKKADERFPYGYGPERYVWALMSAVGIFFLGCGVSVYHGINHLLNPHPLQSLHWAIFTLLFALIVEGIVFFYAYRQLKKASEGKPFLPFLQNEADPASVAVLLEDFAACIGILIALSGILLTQWTHNPIFDALGSILVGVLLGMVAVWLVVRNHSLLLGQSVSDNKLKQIEDLLNAEPSINHVINFRGRMLDLDTYDLQLHIEFDGSHFAKKMEEQLQKEYEQINNYEDFYLFSERFADSLLHELGDEIDRIESKIREVIPEAKHIDLEPE